MKKRLAVILVLVMIWGLCACTSDNPNNKQPAKAYSIVCNDGSTKNMTFSQIKELAQTNGRDFMTLLKNASISGSGVVAENANLLEAGGSWAITIRLDDGLTITYTTDIPYLKNVYTGDTVTFKGKITNEFEVSAWCEDDGYVKLTNIKEDANTIEKYEVARDITKALNSVIDDLEFCKNYVGNVSSTGSRKFADEFVNRLRTSISSLDRKQVQKHFPNLISKLDILSAECGVICDLLEDMGKTNSSQNVNTIKSKAYNLIFDVAITAGNDELYKYTSIS